MKSKVFVDLCWVGFVWLYISILASNMSCYWYPTDLVLPAAAYPALPASTCTTSKLCAGLNPADPACRKKEVGITGINAPHLWSTLPRLKFPFFIVLFGPTLAAMCKQCAIPVTQKASKQRSLFDSGENGGDFTLPQPRFQAVGLAIQA